MTESFIARKTEAAKQLLATSPAKLTTPMRMLLINVDGRRTNRRLLEIAASLGLGHDAVDRLLADGLISQSQLTTTTNTDESAGEASGGTGSPSDPDLRRLDRAKMFAVNLAGRLLAGRDADLRARAQAADNESRFSEWLSEATRRIEATADRDCAELFRERVARAAE